MELRARRLPSLACRGRRSVPQQHMKSADTVLSVRALAAGLTCVKSPRRALAGSPASSARPSSEASEAIWAAVPSALATEPRPAVDDASRKEEPHPPTHPPTCSPHSRRT